MEARAVKEVRICTTQGARSRARAKGLADLFNLAGSLAHRPLLHHIANHPVFYGIAVKTRIPRVSLQYIIELGNSLLLLQSASHPVPDTDTSSAGFYYPLSFAPFSTTNF